MTEFNEDSSDDANFVRRMLSKQSGAIIEEIDPGVVRKAGHRVRRNEEAAVRLVREHTNVPVPQIYMASYRIKNGQEVGSLLMDLVEGVPLNTVWDGFDEDSKRRICTDIWNIAAQLRQIPRPTALEHLFQCGADGSPSIDVPLRDPDGSPFPIETDEELRARIYERYLHFNGGSYPENLRDRLPRSSTSTFTHGDLCPRNIMVDSSGRITGVLDWENAGWYPDYWEYANILKPSVDDDWMEWMDRTKPVKWDIAGIMLARRVLF